MTTAAALQAVANQLTGKPSSEDDALFADLVREAMAALELSDSDLARQFGMSRPSVTRWRNGRTAPHPAMRAKVFKALLTRVRSRMRDSIARNAY
jgi:transcriptional regulator with XRE-family HTH domain